MIKETLRIKNIGPLRDAKLDDIRPVMVLVGATGAGKSLILKILAMMRHVAKKQIIRRALKASGVTKSVFRLRRDTYLQYADIEHLIKADSSIEYTLCDDEIECSVVLDSESFKTDINGLADDDAIGPFMKIAFVSDSRNLVASWAKKGAVIQSKVLDNYFGDTYELWDEAMNSKSETSQDVAFLGLKLKIGLDSGRRKLQLEDSTGHTTLFERGASGQKSSIPVAMIVRYLSGAYSFRDDVHHNFVSTIVTDMVERGADLVDIAERKVASFRRNYLSIHIEEPELSLDPKTQLSFADDLMRTLDSAFRAPKTPEVVTSVIFTTHSPYWVTALNTIVEEGRNSYLTWDRIGGYLVSDAGDVTSLRDDECEILRTPNMDDATQELDDRYNRALEQRGIANA